MDQNVNITLSAVQRSAVKQADLWAVALKSKKIAMENLLKAQKMLEEVQEAVTEYISAETVEGAHNRFLSGIGPRVTPEARYLWTIGHLTVNPPFSLSECPGDPQRPLFSFGLPSVRRL